MKAPTPPMPEEIKSQPDCPLETGKVLVARSGWEP